MPDKRFGFNVSAQDLFANCLQEFLNLKFFAGLEVDAALFCAVLYSGDSSWEPQSAGRKPAALNPYLLEVAALLAVSDALVRISDPW
jgi:hypothetical protein